MCGRVRLAGLLVLGACGRLGFVAADQDASLGADALTFGRFNAPTLVSELADPALDDDPSLTADMLEIYFDSYRGGGDQMYRARRATAQGTWDAPQLVGLSGNDHDPGITPDGLRLFISSYRAGAIGADDLWVTTRPDRISAWSMPTQLVNVSSAARDAVPHMTADGLALFFASMRGTPGFDLYVATRASTADEWGTPVTLTELNTVADEVDPHFCEVEDALYFSSNRTGGVGDRDLYRARRTGTWSFAPPENVGELNTVGFDSDPWLSQDGQTIVFVHDYEIVTAVR